MLDLNFIAELPTDDIALSFYLYEKEARRLRDVGENGELEARRSYMMDMHVFCEAFDINPPLDLIDKFIRSIAGGHESASYQAAMLSIEHVMRRSHMRAAFTIASQKKNFPFDSESKEKIRDYVGQIKTVIDNLDIDEAKRERLVRSLNKFLNEVDTNRTFMESAGQISTQLAGIASDWTGAKQASEVWRRLLELVEKYMAEQPNRLPPPDTQRLEDKSCEVDGELD